MRLSFSGAKTPREDRKLGLMKAFTPARAPAVHNPGLRFFHWLMAALIFVALPLGVWASQLPRGETRSQVLLVHKSIGMTVLCLVVLRIAWRLIAGAPAYAEPLGRLTHAAARSAHIALYGLMIAMPVSGYMESAGSGNRIPWFGLFSFPVLLPKDAGVKAAGGEAHFVLAGTIAFILAAHLGAVAWHATIKRDSVLTRMWPSYRPAARIAKTRPFTTESLSGRP
jgi:cytochrome b561